MRTNVAKKIKMCSENGTSYAWIVVDKCEQTVELRLAGGKAPTWEQSVVAMLLDKDVTRLVKQYCTSTRRKNVFGFSTHTGMSGCRDIAINILSYFGGAYHIIKKVNLLHISCADKLNNGIPKMWIGDFVELAEYLNSGVIAYLRTHRPKWLKPIYVYETMFQDTDVCGVYRCRDYLSQT